MKPTPADLDSHGSLAASILLRRLLASYFMDIGLYYKGSYLKKR
jgi:hypothetical protein